MEIKLLKEAGYEEDILGLSISFYDHKETIEEFWTEEKKVKAAKRAELLAFKQGGHNKFLESIQVWLFIKATRAFWQEFDTYRVGMTKQSSSTMHTLDKRKVDESDFEVGVSRKSIDSFNDCLLTYKNVLSENYKDINFLKNNLPEGWLQERIVCTNYKVLQNIYYQRNKHRYKYWQTFCKFLLDNLEFPIFIKEEENE